MSPPCYATVLHLLADSNASQGRDLRSYERIPCPDLRCTLGDVVDLSLGGLGVEQRCLRPIRPGRQKKILIESFSSRFHVEVECVRAQKIGPRHFRYGLLMLDPDPVTQQEILWIQKVNQTREFFDVN